MMDVKLLATIIAVVKKESGALVKDHKELERKVTAKLQEFHKKSPILETPRFLKENGELICVWNSGLKIPLGRVDGQQGPQGVAGPQGPQGNQGNQGPQGQQGRDGTDGTDGVDGRNGKDGLQGIAGKDGSKGSQGNQGQQGPAGPQGSKGRDGSDGKDGVIGRDGEDGLDGEDGVGIEKAFVNDEHHLIVRLSNGRKIDTGYVRGKPGTASGKGGRVSGGYVGGGGGGGSNSDFPPVTIDIDPPTTGNHDNPLRVGDLWFDSDQLALYVATRDSSNAIVWIICVPGITGVESTQTASLPVAWPKAVDRDEYTNPLTNIVYVFNEPKKQWINVPEQQHEDFDPHIKDHICAEFFKVLKDYNAVEAASGSTMSSYKFDADRVKYWVKPPKKDFFSNGDSIYINEGGPYKIGEVISSDKWTTFFIAGGPKPAVGTTCTLSKTRKLCTELNYLQNEIIELEEEIEALAPTLERGSWRFNPVGSASPAMFAMYAMGTTTKEYPQADQIFINTVDSDGTLHNFNDVEVGSYLEIFSPDDGDYGLYKVTDKSDETGGANAFWMFDVEHSRSNRPLADADLEDKCRIKFFTIAESTDPTSFVMKAGDTMKGDLIMDDSKIKTLFLDSGQNSNLALQHDGNTKVYVGNTQSSFIHHIKLNKEGTDDDHVVTKKYVDDLVGDSSGSGSCVSINGGKLCASDAAPSWAEVIKGSPRVSELKVLNHHTDVQPATEPCMCTADFGGGQIKYWVKPAKKDFFKNGDSIYIRYESRSEAGPFTISQVSSTNVWNTFFINNGPRPKVGTQCSFSKTSKFELSVDGDGLRLGTETPEGYHSSSSGFVFGDYFHYTYSDYASRKHDARVHCETGVEEIIWTFPYTPNGYSDNRTTINDTGTIYVKARDVIETSSTSNKVVTVNSRLTEQDRVQDSTQYSLYSSSSLASTFIKTCFSKDDTFFGVVRHKKADGDENKLIWINYKSDPSRPPKSYFNTADITGETDYHRVFRVRDDVYLTCNNLNEIYRFTGDGMSSISRNDWEKTGFRLPRKPDGVTYETEINSIVYLPDVDRFYLGGKHNGYLSQAGKGKVINGSTFADCVPFGPFVWSYNADEEPLEIWHKHHVPHVSNGSVIQGVPKANYGVGSVFGSGYVIFNGSETYQIEGDPDNTNKFDYDEVQYVPPTNSKICQNGPPHYYTQEHSATGATSLFFGNGHYRYSHNNMYPNPQILSWNGIPVLLGTE